MPGNAKLEPRAVATGSDRPSLAFWPISVSWGRRSSLLLSERTDAAEPRGGVTLTFDLVPAAVVGEIHRLVTDRILMAQLQRNLLEDVVHFSVAPGKNALPPETLASSSRMPWPSMPIELPASLPLRMPMP